MKSLACTSTSCLGRGSLPTNATSITDPIQNCVVHGIGWKKQKQCLELIISSAWILLFYILFYRLYFKRNWMIYHKFGIKYNLSYLCTQVERYGWVVRTGFQTLRKKKTKLIWHFISYKDINRSVWTSSDKIQKGRFFLGLNLDIFESKQLLYYTPFILSSSRCLHLYPCNWW